MGNKSSGERRVETAIRLSRLVKEFALAGIKRQHPKASQQQIRDLWAKMMSFPY